MPKKRYFIDSGFAGDFARSRPLKPVPGKDPLGSVENALTREVSVGTRARCWIWIGVNDASIYLQLAANATGCSWFTVHGSRLHGSRFTGGDIRPHNGEQRTANSEL